MPERTVLPPFCPVAGIPASGLNFIVHLLGYLFSASVFGLGALLIYSCFFDKFYLTALITGILFAWTSLCFILEIPKGHKIKCSLMVDADGLHEIVDGKITNSIFYKDLANSSTTPKRGISLRSDGESYQGMEVFLTDGSTKLLKFTSPSLGLHLGGLYKNKKELVAAFLLGVATFRPDIVIDSNLYWFYKINEATFTRVG